jgi:phage I-like protein
MSTQLISAGYPSALGSSAPAEIVYIPEGDHAITPTIDGKPGKVTVSLPPSRGAAIAAKLQRDLVSRNSENVRPILDFDHRGSGSAAAIPGAFSYRPGIGIVLAIDWTNAGRSAIEGRDFSYFSPTFLLDDDGTPGGLPTRGPIGSLVNNPAFRQMPRIAASDTGGETRFMVAASEAVQRGEARTIEDAYELVAAADPGLYEEYCEELEKANKQSLVRAAQDEKQVPIDHAFEVEAKRLVAAGQAESLNDAFVVVADRSPALYSDYLTTLG